MKSRKNTRNLIVLLVLLVVLMAGMAISLGIYVKHAIHDERTAYLSAQTESVANLIDNIIVQYMDYADACANIVSVELCEDDDIVSFMDSVQSRLYRSDTRMLLVDRDCTWYGEDGSYGRISDVNEYGRNTEPQRIYMTTDSVSEREEMVFRVRLDESVRVKTSTGTAEIGYVAVVCSMDVMTERFHSAFPYVCNCFISNESGLMLFRNLELGLLLDGSNIIAKMKMVEWEYDEVATIVDKMQRGATVVGEMVIKGENYFFCASPLSNNNWSASFVFRADDLTAGSYIRVIFFYMLALALIFALGIAVTAAALLRSKQSEAILEQQREANAMLEQASRAKSEFLSNMSHDIRTPINGIMGMTALAQKQENDPRTEDCLKKIRISSEYLLSLVNDVLDMSSIESGKVIIAREPINLYGCLEGCVSIINGQLQNRTLEVKTDLSGLSHPFVLGDELHLRQVFMNILSNAVKFTPDGGSVTVSAAERMNADGSVTTSFTFRDTGEGMSEEFLKTIWDRFTQAENGSRSKFKGTGLGMAITRQLVDLMGGTIDVQSAPGLGSTFIVTLELEPSAAPQQKKVEVCSIEGCRILLAEDNEINMEIAVELLSDCGAVVTAVENGRLALERFRDNPPDSFDVIMLDIMMPELNGLEATKAIRALPRNDARVIPIIAMTANAFDDDLRTTREAGMNAHLTKPIDIDEVVRMVSTFYRKG